jgi:hypothetical protein
MALMEPQTDQSAPTGTQDPYPTVDPNGLRRSDKPAASAAELPPPRNVVGFGNNSR